MEQTQRLRAVVAAAQKHPVYAAKLSGLELSSLTADSLSSLPLTTRQEWLDYIQAHPQAPQGSSLMHLTPSPAIGWMPEYLNQHDEAHQATALAEHFRRLGVDGKRAVVAFGYHVFAGGWLFHQALQQAGAMVLPHGPGEAERIAQWQQKFGLDILVSNPSFALKVAQAGGRFELLLAAGEPFTSVEGYRAQVEAALGGKALDMFGTSELGLVAAEGLEQRGLEVVPGMAVIEVLDPETLQPTPNGEKGEMVVTALSRSLMPMLRFRTGDLALVEREGSLIRLPKGVIGRTDLMVKVKGVKLYPTELGPVLMAFGLEPRQGSQVLVERGTGGTDKLTLKLKTTEVPEGLAAALQKATGLRFDAVLAEAGLEGPPLVDVRY